MNQIAKQNTLDSTERPEEVKGALRLELNIRDANVVKYLTGFEESQREDKAVEALKGWGHSNPISQSNARYESCGRKIPRG